MDIQIKELQEKAFAGDEKAHELYNEYVNRGEAPAINVNNSKGKNTAQLISEGYEKLNPDNTDLEGKSTYFDGREIERPLTILEKMSMGYNSDFTQKKEVNVNPNDIKEKKETKERKEVPKKDTRSPLEKMIAGLS